MASEATESFKQHYDQLTALAEKMRQAQEPDIDALVDDVDKALGSYKFCKHRLEAVKKLLDERFGTAEEVDKSKPQGSDFEDDIPF